ncbi:MAG: phosphatidate cytidylyltransferase [Deltaproteobacteria bacterium]|nr:phosphatidate cytidylyltransferase [Deltaproteobacteria bacterium]
MTKRIVTGIILAAVVLGVVGFGPFWLLAPLLWLAVLAALHEFLGLQDGVLDPMDRAIGVLAGALLLSIVSYYPSETLMPMLIMTLAILSVVLLLYVLFRPGAIETAGPRASTLLSGLMYVALLGSFALMIARPETGPKGRIVLLMVAAVTWLNDTMAFFGGKLMGKHRLYQKVSPNKTWEGSVTGLAGSVIGAFIIKWVFVDLMQVVEVWSMPAWQLVAFAVVGGALGQVGDLVESVFKRSYGVKDSGAIIPGHGGMLDRIDAFLFVAPFGFFFFYFV